MTEAKNGKLRPIMIDYSTFSSKEVKLSNSNTDVSGSCFTLWNNEVYGFGGSKLSSQIIRVKNCALEQKGELDFEFSEGFCVTTQSAIYLCFRQGH